MTAHELEASSSSPIVSSGRCQDTVMLLERRCPGYGSAAAILVRAFTMTQPATPAPDAALFKREFGQAPGAYRDRARRPPVIEIA
jgi:hypothetical protein